MADTQDQSVNPSLPASTTFQQDLVTAGQRRINVIWETTQAFIACAVVLANMIVGVYDGLSTASSHTEYPVILSSSLFLIVGFYFSRTNHANIGGTGDKRTGTIYTGR